MRPFIVCRLSKKLEPIKYKHVIECECISNFCINKLKQQLIKVENNDIKNKNFIINK